MGTAGGLALSTPMVAISATVSRRSAAQAAGAALLFVPAIAGAIVASSTREPWGRLLSLMSQLDSLGAWAFGVALQEKDRPLPTWAAAGMLALIVVASVVWLRVRIAALTEDAS